MTRAVFQRGPQGTLVPADDAAKALVESLKAGEGLTVEAKRHRNVKFHRKFFSLLRLAFDAWEPAEVRTWRGEPLRKDFDQFRHDILILAGHFDAHYGVDGTAKLVARSVSFANCSESAFRDIYGAVLDVVWDRVLRYGGYDSKDEVENVLNELLAYC